MGLILTVYGITMKITLWMSLVKRRLLLVFCILVFTYMLYLAIQAARVFNKISQSSVEDANTPNVS